MTETEYIPIEDNPSLVKDTRSGAIINISESGYRAALLRKERAKKDIKLRHDVDELKTMVELILKKLDK